MIGGAIANSNSYYRGGGGSAHVQWCYDRYRSYRASDNTFQPYNGPRQQCYSPYWLIAGPERQSQGKPAPVTAQAFSYGHG